MAKPYEEGSGWCIRQRYRGHDIYVSGRESAAAAQKEVSERIAAIDKGGKPQHLGPKRTSLAHAMREFGLEHLPHLKGAQQEVRRINKYLEAAGLRLLRVQRASAQSAMHYEADLQPLDAQRMVPQGLVAHRRALLTKTAGSDKLRTILAHTAVAKITRLQVQRFMDALAKEGLAPATIALERALLRRFFNHARTKWSWAQPGDNPATALTLPTVDNERDRVLSYDEQVRLDAAFDEAQNPTLRHVCVLLRETAMRASEPLLHATWSCVDWESKVLKLRDSKGGKRKVPLSSAAIEALNALEPGEPDQPLVQVSYESLKAGFKRACKRAGITDFHLHDLRHTAATRLAKKSGNVTLVKALTGHKTFRSVARYMNVKAEDVVEHMQKEREQTPAPVSAPGLYDEAQLQALVEKAVQEALAQVREHAVIPRGQSYPGGANVIPFRRPA